MKESKGKKKAKPAKTNASQPSLKGLIRPDRAEAETASAKRRP